MTAATNAALEGVEKGANKAMDHVIHKVGKKPKTKTLHQQARFNNISSSSKSKKLNNIISGSGIATIHDFVNRYK